MTIKAGRFAKLCNRKVFPGQPPQAEEGLTVVVLSREW